MATTALMHGKNKIRQKLADINKKLIMDTAARLFAESSYDSVSLDDIAARMDATKGLIYHYFPSKSHLLGELMLWHFQIFLDYIAPAWETGAEEPVEKLKQVIRTHIDFNFEYSHMTVVMSRSTYGLPHVLRRKIRKQRDDYAVRLYSLVEEVQQGGRLIAGNGKVITACIANLASYMPYTLRHDSGLNRKDIYEVVLKLFFPE